MSRLFLVPALIATLCILFASEALGQITHTVTTIEDAGPGSLRQAIQDAAPGDTIGFEQALMGQRISLSSSTLSLDKDLTIQGTGLPFQEEEYVEISGNGALRVFEIQPGVKAFLSNLVIEGGYAETDGGGLWVGEGADITLEHVHLTGNTALDNGGAVFISGESDVLLRWVQLNGNKAEGDLSPNGGGIYNASGNVRAETSIISGNESARGGGIWNTGNGVVELVNTLVRGNIATIEGGGLYNNHKMIIEGSTVAENQAGVEAGGIRNRSGDSLVVVNSTISSNSAPQTGGLYNFRASKVFIYNSTLVANASDEEGAGIFNEEDGSVSLYSSIVAANLRDGSVHSDVLDQSAGLVVSEGFNIVGARGSLSLVETDQSGTVGAPFNPQLEALAQVNNALVHVPRESSLAIDQGECMERPLFLDQSGFLRTVDISGVDNASDGCDVGAVEYTSLVNVSNEEPGDVRGINHLSPAFPNPFSTDAFFEVTVEQDQEVRIEVFDILGRRVDVIYNGFVQGGVPHRFKMGAGHKMSSGLYIFHIEGATISQSRSVLLRK